MVAALDTMVGRVVAALREAQLYNNSIIVFVSDNGANPLQVSSFCKVDSTDSLAKSLLETLLAIYCS